MYKLLSASVLENNSRASTSAFEAERCLSPLDMQLCPHRELLQPSVDCATFDPVLSSARGGLAHFPYQRNQPLDAINSRLSPQRTPSLRWNLAYTTSRKAIWLSTLTSAQILSSPIENSIRGGCDRVLGENVVQEATVASGEALARLYMVRSPGGAGKQ